MRIGIIGSGQIGGAVGKRWAEAGHQILFSSRNPDELAPLVAEAGPNAHAGTVADEAVAKGTGVASAEFFPGTRLVRAFNAVSFTMVEEQHHREGALIGIPVAGDDAEAVAITERLVRDAGFDPVFVGPLSSARRFDRGTDVYVRGMTAAELRQALNL